MGLTIWNMGTDPYDHEELAENFAKIDAHDHTSNKGARIGTAAIADGAITAEKLDPDAVEEFTLTDGIVTTPKLATDAVTSDKILNGSIVNADVAASAAIDASKISLTGAVVNSMVSGSAAIEATKLDTGDGRLVQKTGIATASGNLALTTSYQDVTGASVTFTPDVNCYAIVHTSFNFFLEL